MTNITTPTTGPLEEWTVWLDPDGKDICAYIDCDGISVAHVYDEYDASRRDKNAALIAAAPDLLAVAKEILNNQDALPAYLVAMAVHAVGKATT